MFNLFLVSFELLLQRLHAFKLSFVAQLSAELHSHFSSVYVALEADDVRFDGGLLALEGRVVADVEHCRHPLAALYAHPCGVDAVLRHELLRALRHDVRRGESYSSALLKAVRHAARDRVGVAQAVVRLQDVALSKQTPYERRRHTQPVDVYRRVRSTSSRITRRLATGARTTASTSPPRSARR